MRQEPGHLDGPSAFATSASGSSVPVAAAATATPSDATVALPRFAPLRVPRALRSLRWPDVEFGPTAGRIALATITVCALAMVLFSTHGPTILVPRSSQIYASWEAGPLYHVLAPFSVGATATNFALSGLILAMLASYLVALGALRALPMRLIAGCVVAVQLILLLGPPFQLTDMFNYLGYARLGGLHGLNPYTHVIGQEMHDPVYHFATWANLHSPYGELFSALTYPLAFLSLPVAYWIVKVATVSLSLALVAIVSICARRLGRDPRYAAVLVGLNPIFLVYAVGGFHNDFFMLVPAVGAIALLLSRRDRTAGAVLMLAVAVKFTAILLLPFLLVGAATARRRWNVVIGAVLAGIPLLAMSLALFGFSLPNLSQQNTLLTPFSFPNLFGYFIGVGGGTSGVLRLASVALVVVVVLLVRRRGDWISHAGWATVALIASLAWVMPWYVIWVLPLAALGSSLWLRRAALVMTVFLVLVFLPSSSKFWNLINFNPLSGSAGQASQTLQAKLSWYR
jgi:Glycosyltransferase family 87